MIGVEGSGLTKEGIHGGLAGQQTNGLLQRLCWKNEVSPGHQHCLAHMMSCTDSGLYSRVSTNQRCNPLTFELGPT